MLYEFAISPEIFRTDCYKSSELAEICLGVLSGPFRDDCIVRNLRNGGWLRCLEKQEAQLHPKGKEFLRKLKKQNRLACSVQGGETEGWSDVEWEIEAASSHKRRPLTGMIFSQKAKRERHAENRFVSCPEKLAYTDFWRNRRDTRRIPRVIDDYAKLLDPILRHANFIAFIDPYLDPREDRYKGFLKLLTSDALVHRNPPARIEIHRVAWFGNGRNKKPEPKDIEKFKESLRSQWEQSLKQSGVRVEVFLWDDIHDRFVVSDLLGMSWSNGFDTSKNRSEEVTVCRMDRTARDKVQAEFARNSVLHRLQTARPFVIGAS